MSKTKTTSYTLARGRTQPFKKTITYLSEQPLLGPDGKPVLDGKGKPVLKMLPDPKRPPVQFVFEADNDIELTDEEIEHLGNAIKGGYVVPTNRDAKGRQRNAPPDYVPNADEIIAKLEAKIEEQAATIATLTKELEAATKPK